MSPVLEQQAGTRAGLPELLEGFAAMHQAMRRDSRRLELAAGRIDSRSSAATLNRWYRRFRATIEHHHQREDDMLWPGLVARDPSFAESMDALADDHHHLDAALAGVAAAIDDLVAGRTHDQALVVAAAVHLRSLLCDHLDREEAAAFPRIAATYSEEEYAEIERGFRRGLSMRDLAFEAPWVLDELPAEQARKMIASVPAPLRVLYAFVFLPSYRRLAAPMLEVAR